jgi:hypothetical protein
MFSACDSGDTPPSNEVTNQTGSNNDGGNNDKPIVSGDAASIKADIKAAIARLSQDQKNTMKDRLTEKNLPTQYTKVTDPAVLQSILDVITE